MDSLETVTFFQKILFHLFVMDNHFVGKLQELFFGSKSKTSETFQIVYQKNNPGILLFHFPDKGYCQLTDFRIHGQGILYDNPVVAVGYFADMVPVRQSQN